MANRFKRDTKLRERPMIYFGKCRSLNSLKRLRKQYNF